MSRLGPDALRYLALANGEQVPRPFHLRWLLPTVCGEEHAAWRAVRRAAWVVAALGMLGWCLAAGMSWQAATAATVLLLALPGILGPQVVNPVGVDLPATAVTLLGAFLFELGNPLRIAAAVVLWCVAAAIKETSPVFAALWVWSPIPLVALAVVAVRALLVKPGPDPLGPRFQHIADHPIRSALDAHRTQWRNGWIMVAPWGACLAALYAPSWQLVVVLAVAYAQLFVATDTVRLLHHAAGPVMAMMAAQTIPMNWLMIVVVLHTFWFRNPERL